MTLRGSLKKPMTDWLRKILVALQPRYNVFTPEKGDNYAWIEGHPNYLSPEGILTRESRVSRSFIPGGLITAPRRVIKVFEQIRALKNAQLNQSHSSGITISIAAANVNRVQSLYEIDSNVIACFTGASDEMPVWASHVQTMTFIGNKPFSLLPFVIIGEGGESIASLDSNSEQPVVAARAAWTAGTFQIGFGEVYESRRKYEGSVVYRIDLTMQLAGWFNYYADYYFQKLMAEEEAAHKDLRVGIVAFGQASTTITYDIANFTAFFQHPVDKMQPIGPS